MSGFLSGRTSLTTVQTADIAANAIDGTLTKDALVGDYSDVTITAADLIMYGDATDSNNTKRDTVQGVLDLAGGAGLTFISSTDISSAATYDFTAVDASSYDGYGFFLQNIVPVTDAVHLWMRTSTDGGSSYDDGASDYNWGLQVSGAIKYDLADGYIGITSAYADGSTQVGSDTNESGVSGWVWLCGPHITKYTMVSWNVGTFAADGYVNNFTGCGVRLENADVDACRFYFSSGNIETGTITAYGLANA